MAKVLVEGFLYAEQVRDYDFVSLSFKDFIQFTVIRHESETSSLGALVGPVSFEHTLPDGYDMQSACLAHKIAELAERKRKAGEDFARVAAECNEQIAKLQALTNCVEA